MRTALKVVAASLILAGTSVVAWAGLFCVHPDLPIPDSNPTGASSDMTINLSFTLTDLEVTIVAAHTWVGDLTFRLAKVSGPGAPVGPATLIQRPGVPGSTFGCSIDNISTHLLDATATSVNTVCHPIPPAIDGGPYHPAPDNLSVFSGVNMMGTWRMTVSDSAGGDTGTLVEWCLFPGPEPVELMQFSIE